MRALFRTIQLSSGIIGGFGLMLGQILNSFIMAAAKDEAQTSPNYLYILFETTAQTLRYLKPHPEAF
jgi:hypothetical protein